MRLKLFLPGEKLVDAAVTRIRAEAPNGAFCLLPRHVDFVTTLTAGLLSYEDADSQQEVFLAVDQGVLVKCGEVVRVSAPNAVVGPGLGRLRETVEKRFQNIEKQERRALNAMSRIEADFVRRFLEIRKHGG
jgi:F-type H+-transporting ATPase subunit epsilon